jgi:hypothetical protein
MYGTNDVHPDALWYLTSLAWLPCVPPAHPQPVLAEMPGGSDGRRTSELAVHVVLYGGSQS